MKTQLLILATALGFVNADPEVHLRGYGRFSGTSNGAVTSYLGIPFAQPPINDLRFRHAKAPLPFTGVANATSYGLACVQTPLFTNETLASLPPDLAALFQAGLPVVVADAQSEDCLTINVFSPSWATPRSKLSVVVFFYGGAFSVGFASGYDPVPVVQASVESNLPVVYVTFNYRMGAMGLLGGREVKEAKVANLALTDQRQALKFVNKHIRQFGGDPSKVTLSGQSAGAMSIAYHLLLDNGNPRGLFRGAFMESGAIPHLAAVDSPEQQGVFDTIVVSTNCSAASDKVDCLRSVPLDVLTNATAPLLAAFTAGPRADGHVLKEQPGKLLSKGRYAKVPIVTGNTDDEGTMFAILTPPLNTSEESLGAMKQSYWPNMTDAELAQLGAAYPDDPAAGSPFYTGAANSLWPQYKRFSAMQGDVIFVQPRRRLLRHLAKTQKTWSFLYQRGKAVPIVGAIHGIELFLEIFPPGLYTSDKVFLRHLLSFAHNLNPNFRQAPTKWPQYKSSGKASLTFKDGNITVVEPDLWRRNATDLLERLSDKYPW